jgi:hypothetical protein
MDKKISQFLVSVLVLLILPLLPLLGEYFKTQDIKEDSITLCLAFYAFCLMSATKSPVILFLCLIIGIIESLRYNGTNPKSGLPTIWSSLDLLLFGLVFVSHVFERIKRHCVKGEIFFTFTTS